MLINPFSRRHCNEWKLSNYWTHTCTYVRGSYCPNMSKKEKKINVWWKRRIQHISFPPFPSLSFPPSTPGNSAKSLKIRPSRSYVIKSVQDSEVILYFFSCEQTSQPIVLTQAPPPSKHGTCCSRSDECLETAAFPFYHPPRGRKISLISLGLYECTTSTTLNSYCGIVRVWWWGLMTMVER